MKKVIIGSLVGTIIYFAFQSTMWMSGFNNDFSSYTPKQDSIMQYLSMNLDEDGLYAMPMPDPNDPAQVKDHETNHEKNVGKPWAMLFYHNSMQEMHASSIVMGVVHTLIGCILVCLVLFYGNFSSFSTRFLVAMAFSVFALSQGAFNDMNWWSFPWSYIRPQVMNLIVGWGICSAWLAWFVKK